CRTRSRPTRRARRAGRRTASAFLAPPPHQLVREPAAHHLVQCARGELLLEVHRAVARELVHETGELGSYEHPQILVLGLRGHFARGHDPHHLLLPVDCFSWAASLRSCRTKSDSKLATSRGARCATSRPPPCTRSMTSRTARSRSSFTSTWSYTSPSSRRAVSTCASSRTPSTQRSREAACAARARWSSCRLRTGRRARRPAVSLQVVELLPKLLELAFHGDDGLRYPRVVGLRPDGVHLAQQLLREEPELLPHRSVGDQRLATRREVGPQPHELLGDVHTVGHQGDFDGKPLLIHRHARRELRHRLLQAR